MDEVGEQAVGHIDPATGAEAETALGKEVTTEAHQTLPAFLENYATSVEGYAYVLPFVVSITQVVGRGAKDVLDTDYQLSPTSVKTATPKKISAAKLSELRQVFDYFRFFMHGAQRLPSIMLTAMITELEVLIAEAIKWAFRQRAELFRKIDRTVTIADLEGLGDINDLKDVFLEREIDELLRKSPKEQIESVQKLLGIDVLTAVEDQPAFFEIFHRRNIIVHAGGKATRQYVSALRRLKIPEEKIPSIGTVMSVNQEYFENATDTLLNMGVMFGLRIWWKFDPQNRKEVDSWLMRYAFQKIQEQNYAAALQLFSMVEKLNYKYSEISDEYRMLVNRAQAFKWSGNETECNGITNRDWSGSSAEFRLCISVLKEDFEAASLEVKTLGTSGGMKFESYCSWPVFKYAREKPVFKSAVEEVFKMKLVTHAPPSRDPIDFLKGRSKRKVVRKPSVKTSEAVH